ncbi:hypothetical protein [uncultured Cetobacterium sp.]|uniref:hypothetical protein n=1 Tax=uncultured Cetobacterium sp. TaxID=527638 RepID=UPI00261E6024|nr:hypothetical protein [uncultured Cetobacterium sp.]
MNKLLQDKIFRELLNFHSQGDIFEEKEIITLGCMANGSTKELQKKILTTIDLQTLFQDYSLNEINENASILADKELIKINRVTTTTNKNYLELLEPLVSLDDFLDEI